MSKIFLTGMTAPQSSLNANTKNLSFSSAINLALQNAGHTVVWADPKIDITKDELDSYDSVIVGIAPVTSLSANKIYGALNIINLLWGSDKLNLLIDAPNVSQIATALRSVKNNPNTLTKDFFSNKKGYQSVVSDKKLQSNILKAIDNLLDQDWPTTLIPVLPWKQSYSDKELNLPELAKKSITYLNLDSYLIEDPTESLDKVDKWTADQPESTWTKKISKTIELPISPVKINKGSTDVDVLYQIARSVGILLSPYKNEGTWWSYKYVQSINSLTPVATLWEESGSLGSEWNLLASTIDSMSEEKRALVATAQRESYIAKIPNKKQSIKMLEKALKLTN
jgi:hypothetical protein